MSAHSSPSPVQGPTTHIDEAHFPKGNCRYILLMPEIKGQRCACVNFTLNKAIPGATCDCGHLACYHNRDSEPRVDRNEFGILRQRMQALEEQLARDQQDELHILTARISDLEETVQDRTNDMSQEITKSYGNLNRAWQTIGDLERQVRHHDDRFNGVEGSLKAYGAELERLNHRQCELDDADLSLEERIEELEESLESSDETTPSRSRRKSRSDSTPPPPNRQFETVSRVRRSSISTPVSQPASTSATTSGQVSSVRQTFMAPRTALMSAAETWTVHISLLPTSSKPFPFERDTNAYKRCLSVGLHQMVAVNGSDSEAFVSAVNDAFASLLRGRPWMPLQAKLCDAQQLQGLPMLRPLEPSLVDCRYDVEFLKRHCAVLDISGKIDSLYIAMRYDTFSWHYLRRSPRYLLGLEASWEYDPLLDPNNPIEEEDDDDIRRPPAGDLASSFQSFHPMKRTASEISRSSSFGSATVADGEGSRPKVARRIFPPPANVGPVRARVETV